MPKKFALPDGMEEAMLVVETGLHPDVIDNLSESIIDRILIYKAVKNVCQNGGNLDL